MLNTKPKLDPKVRFQQSKFRNQLENARQYKRNPRAVPDSEFKLFLQKIGLGSMWAQLGVAVLCAGLVYVVYVPNFLFIKTIDVNGLEPETRKEVNAIIQEFFSKELLSAQKNILFLSKDKLSKYITDRAPSVLKISTINKSFPSTVVITAEQRTSQFLVISKHRSYRVSSDGLVQQESASTTPLQLFVAKIQLLQDLEAQPGELILPEHTQQLLKNLQHGLESKLRLALDYFEMENLQSTEITAQVQAGYKLYFDSKSDLDKIFDQVKLMLNNLEDSQKRNLYYVDMRYADRAFVCYKNSPCTKTIPLTSTPTSTLESINFETNE